MADLTNDIIQKIYEIYKEKGYISENSVFDFIIDAGIPLDETDRVIDRLLSMGVLIQDEPVPVQPVIDSEDENDVDRTQLDYEEIYSRVLEIDPSLDYIIDYVRQVPAPRTHEIANLMVQAKSGNEYARNRIIELMLKIPVKMALNFSERYHTDLGDTIQYAFEGLMTAYEKFELGRQDNFTTYAPWWIRQNMHRTIDICSGLHTPAHFDETLMAVRDEMEEHFCDECHSHYICPNLVQNICDKLVISPSKVIMCIRMMETPIPIDELVEEESTELMSWKYDELVDEVIYWDLSDKINDVFLTLTLREAKVLTLKYGLDDGREKTLEEVGREFQVTRERIRQIEAKALRKLRHPSRSKRLKDYLDCEFPMILTERFEEKALANIKSKKDESRSYYPYTNQYYTSEIYNEDIEDFVDDEIEEIDDNEIEKLINETDLFEDEFEEYVEPVSEDVEDKEIITTKRFEERSSYENSPRVLLHDASIEQIQEMLASNSELSSVIEESLCKLMIREREVVRMRLGLAGYPVCSVREVAQKFNVCDDRIRQYEAKFLRHFRHYLEGKPPIYGL